MLLLLIRNHLRFVLKWDSLAWEYFFLKLHTIESQLFRSFTMCLVPPFLTHFDSEGMYVDVGDVDGELCQAMLIRGGNIGVAKFPWFDEDLLIWDGGSFGIH